MKLKVIYFFALLLTLPLTHSFSVKAEIIATQSLNKVSQDGFLIYSVKKGETVYSIAKSYNLSVEDIYAINKWANKGIKAGDKLKIPNAKNRKDNDNRSSGKKEQIKESSKPIVGYRNHKIEPKQTLYSLALIYNVSVDDILSANPGLTQNNIKTGKIIQIPIYKIESSSANGLNLGNVNDSSNPTNKLSHTVLRGETVYKICKSYNISEEDLYKNNPTLMSGLKVGMNLIIPDTSAITTVSTSTATMPYLKEGEAIRIGILMPFLDKNEMLGQSKIVEYYNGFLLAVSKLKEMGYNIDLYTFDIGPDNDTQKLRSLLNTNEVKNLHLIIGGISPQQISLMTDFSLKTGIKYVIPFGTKRKGATGSIFQMNTSHSYLYPKIITAFRTKFKNDNIIFVSEAGSDNNKADFVKDLKSELSSNGLKFNDITSTVDLLTSLNASIDKSRNNIIVPKSSSEATIKKLLTVTKSIRDVNISFFGYPDWQTYHAIKDQLFKQDSYIYSTFYVDDKNPQAKDIFEAYKKWYNRPMGYSYPRFGLLGYDMGLYFMTALNQYGLDFDQHLDSINVNTLQSSVFFEPDIADGGYINTGVYFIRFKPDMNIEKTEYTNK